ncbi:hypothetical protein [Halosimplex halophilum]|nr:hypothetical protein [Halosimplex halophilum]
MREVVCEDCQHVQQVTDLEAPECSKCGSRSLTATAGYESAGSPTA